MCQAILEEIHLNMQAEKRTDLGIQHVGTERYVPPDDYTNLEDFCTHNITSHEKMSILFIKG